MNALLWLGVIGATVIAVVGAVMSRAWLRERAESKRMLGSPVRPLRRGLAVRTCAQRRGGGA